jgi:hypothetical protein
LLTGRLLELVRFDDESHGLKEDAVDISGHIFNHQLMAWS